MDRVRAVRPATEMTDQELIAWARGGSAAEAFRILMQRNNRSVYRLARSVLRDDVEAEDAVQDGYCLAFLHLQQFNEASSFSTWLGRIVLNEALRRISRRRIMTEFEAQAGSPGDKESAEIISVPPAAHPKP